MADDRDTQRGASSGWIRYAGMGAELAGAIVGFTLIGYFVDVNFGTGPGGVAIGAILGIIGGFYNFIRTAIRLSNEQFGRPPRRNPQESKDDQHPPRD